MVRIQVDPVEEPYISQSCWRCGRRRKANKKHQGLYVCDKCGLVINFDIGAGVNIVHELELETFKDYYAMKTFLRPISVKI